MPFSFLNAALLVGAAAAALPILIHLFSRRRVQKVRFSSLQFLEQISRRRVRRVRMTQWIILALRVLALALLALALSRPAFKGDFAFGASRGESAVAIVLDRSYSMAAEGEAGTLWEKARERAGQILEVVEGSDRVIFVGVEPRGEDVDAYPEPMAARDALRGMEVGYRGTDLVAGVRRAAAALAETPALNKELFVISDFQTAGIPAGTADVLGVLEEGTRVYLLPVGEGPIPNTALEDVRAEGSAVEQRVRVLLARHGGTGVGDLALTVEAGNEILGERTVSLGPGERDATDVALSRLPGSGETLLARLSRDRLPVDDVRYVPPLGTSRIPTLLLQDPAQPSPYLPLALSPDGSSGRFQVDRRPPAEIQSVNLGDYQLLVLDNVSYLPRSSLVRLRQWREAGGLLFVALGDRVDLRYCNEDLLPALFPGVRLGNLLGSDEATGTSYSLTPRVPGHAAFAGFEAEMGRPITGAQFWRIVEVQGEGDLRTLAEFGPGLPAIVEGDGAVLFASSLDGRWNNLPTHAAFLPLVHQSLEAVLRERGGENTVVGEPLRAAVERSEVPSGAELFAVGPGGVELAVTPTPTRRGLTLESEPAPVPGFYDIRAAERTLTRRAVNVDPAESDLTPLEADQILALFPGERVTLLAYQDELRNPVREARYGREFWKELVVLVLLLLGIESWLARRGVS